MDTHTQVELMISGVESIHKHGGIFAQQNESVTIASMRLSTVIYMYDISCETHYT